MNVLLLLHNITKKPCQIKYKEYFTSSCFFTMKNLHKKNGERMWHYMLHPKVACWNSNLSCNLFWIWQAWERHFLQYKIKFFINEIHCCVSNESINEWTNAAISKWCHHPRLANSVTSHQLAELQTPHFTNAEYYHCSSSKKFNFGKQSNNVPARNQYINHTNFLETCMLQRSNWC